MSRQDITGVVLGLVGSACALSGCTETGDDTASGGGITITQPTSAPVTVFDFPVEVQLEAGAFHPTTVTATLNDSPLTLHGGPVQFSALVLTLDGSTTVQSTNGDVELLIRIQSPLWAAYDRIEIYANADTVVAATNDDISVLYGAEPTLVLLKGADFNVSTVDVVPEVAGAQRFETNVTVPFTDLSTDTWFVVVARGTDGTSSPMFPIVASDLSRASNASLADLTDGNLGEGGVLPLGFTNALYADVDGVAGFQAPRR